MLMKKNGDERDSAKIIMDMNIIDAWHIHHGTKIWFRLIDEGIPNPLYSYYLKSQQYAFHYCSPSPTHISEEHVLLAESYEVNDHT
jgi:hypothetical protein